MICALVLMVRSVVETVCTPPAAGWPLASNASVTRSAPSCQTMANPPFGSTTMLLCVSEVGVDGVISVGAPSGWLCASNTCTNTLSLPAGPAAQVATNPPPVSATVWGSRTSSVVGANWKLASTLVTVGGVAPGTMLTAMVPFTRFGPSCTL